MALFGFGAGLPWCCLERKLPPLLSPDTPDALDTHKCRLESPKCTRLVDHFLYLLIPSNPQSTADPQLLEITVRTPPLAPYTYTLWSVAVVAHLPTLASKGHITGAFVLVSFDPSFCLCPTLTNANVFLSCVCVCTARGLSVMVHLLSSCYRWTNCS